MSWVSLQGDYSGGATLGNLVNFVLMTLLSGTNTRYGLGGTDSFDYSITTIDQNVAAGQLVIIDAGQLLVGEDFTFNASAETDGSYRLWGGQGTDVLTGGQGSDFFFFSADRFNTGDRIDGGGGTAMNQISLLGDYTIALGANQIANIQSLTFLSGRDLRNPTDFDYTITMHDNNLAPAVRMIVDAGQLKATEKLDFDGSAETNGTFWVLGGAGADVLKGGAGNDLIVGAAGADTMTGGAGNDVFRYNNVSDTLPNGGNDFISDFGSGDRIDLSRIDANPNAHGDPAFSFIGSQAFTNQAGQLRVVNAFSNAWLVEGDIDGNGQADFQILLNTSDADPLTAADFIL